MPVAVFQISEYNGATETETANVSNLNVGNVDQPNITPGPSNAITAGNNAYVKYHKFKCTTFGALNQIDQLKFWKSSGTYSTGVSIDCSLRTSSYSEPTYATPTTATYTDQAMPTSEPSSANLGIGGSLTGTITAVNQYSDRMKWQTHTTTSTPAGNMNTLTFTFQWREQ
jgi:hypothetical protein